MSNSVNQPTNIAKSQIYQQKIIYNYLLTILYCFEDISVCFIDKNKVTNKINLIVSPIGL